MYELLIYKGNNKGDKVQGTKEQIKEALNGYTWNDNHEITIKERGEVKYYVKYEDEFQYLKRIL